MNQAMARDALGSYELFKGSPTTASRSSSSAPRRSTVLPARRSCCTTLPPPACTSSSTGPSASSFPVAHVELGPGECVGELALLVPGSRRIARVRAVRGHPVPQHLRDVFEQLLETEPSFTLALLRGVAKRLVEAR